MGVTKQYLRYVPGPFFNIIGTSSSIIHLKRHGVVGRFLATSACEHVIIWDIRQGEKALILPGEDSQVSSLAADPNHNHLAVGYCDGAVRIFSLESAECQMVFHGHKSAVTCLSYNFDGTQLVSGSKDTDIVVWDVVNESGILRLRGHKGVVTKCVFVKNRNLLISSSKDTFIKFWDLDTNHCFHTLVGHQSEVWDFVLLRNDTCLVTGSGDAELRGWTISYKEQVLSSESNETQSIAVLPEDTEDENTILQCEPCGSFIRHGQGRLVSIVVDDTSSVFGCHGTDNTLELFKLLSVDELNTRLRRRQKKERHQREQSGAEQDPVITEKLTFEHTVKRLPSIRIQGKVKGFDLTIDGHDTTKVFVLVNNNSIATYSTNHTLKDNVAAIGNKLWIPGHRTDVRTLSFSSDNTGVLSASSESVKIWNRPTQQCVRTMECGFALSSIFAPGDRHCVIGTKNGKLQIFDISAGNLLETVDAHSGTIWSLCSSPEQRGFVSGSADKEVKFWDFEMIKDEETKSSRLSIVHTRTLKMSDDVLSLKISPDNRLIAVALLDSTVKVFFIDTLKFFLSMYGHKLPVLCVDISFDSTLMVTGSADRNIKIWGLDFGDCHRSLFAHDDSVMCIQFVPKSHLFFSGGKDGRVNQWDADTFQRIITLKGHHGPVWALATSPNGQHVVSASHDKTLRLWEKTQEPLVLDEQREIEREEEYEKNLVTEESSVIPGETNEEATLAGRKTIETVKSAEKLMEGLDIYLDVRQRLDEHQRECQTKSKQLPVPTAHPLMMAYNCSTPNHFIMEVLKRIKSSELEEALLVLPFNYVVRLLEALSVLLEKGWHVELVCRCLFFLLRVHHGQITSNHMLVSTIEELRVKAAQRVSEIKDMINFNMAGLNFVKQEIESKEQVLLFADASKQVAEKRKKKRKREKEIKRAILSL